MATLQELARRGHRIVVRSGAAEVGLLRSIGIDAGLLAPELTRFEPQDWRARTRFGALMRALIQFGERAGDRRASSGVPAAFECVGAADIAGRNAALVPMLTVKAVGPHGCPGALLTAPA